MGARNRAIRGAGVGWMWAVWAVVPLLVLLIYVPTVGFGFVWDDEQVLFGRADYHDPRRWLEAVRQPLDFSPNYFRPLALSTLLVQIWLWKANPAPFHVANGLLHALNTALVMVLAWRLWRHGWVTALAGLLYGLHPALTESVAFIASRYDLTVTTFLLLALIISTSASRWRWLGVGLCFLLAALCKEMAVVLPLLLPAWHLAHSYQTQPDLHWREQVRQIFQAEGRTYLAILIAGVVYLSVRYAALGYLYQPPVSEARMEVGTPLQHLLLIGRTFATLIGLVGFPFFSISPAHHSALPVPLNDGLAWLQLGFTAACLVGAMWLIRRAPAVGWLLMAGIISLLPVLNLRPLEMAKGIYTAERFLTFPLTLFVLTAFQAALSVAWERQSAPNRRATAWLQKGLSGQRLLMLGASVWLGASLITVALNMPNWKENLTLWEWMTRASPRSPIGFSNLADMYNKLGRHEEALKAAERAIQLAPDSGMGWVNKGVALLKLGHTREAEQHFRRATEIEPANVIGWNNLAIMLGERGEFAEAERIVRQHVIGRPPLFMGYQALGILYLKQGRPDKAEPVLKQASQALPLPGSLPEQLLKDLSRPGVWLAGALVNIERGELDVAEQLYRRAEQLGGDRVALAYVRGRLLIAKGRSQEAERLARELIEYGWQDPRLNEILRLARQQPASTR